MLPKNIEDVYPMSDIQKGMVLLSVIQPEKAVYHDQFVYPIPSVDLSLFQKALELMVEKHSTLRTWFDLDSYSKEVQLIEREIAVEIDSVELSHLAKEEQEEHIKAYILTERGRPFDVKSAPLWRASIFHLSDTRSVFLFQFHHAILDGWSVASFNTELFFLYTELEKNPDFQPEKLKSTFKDSVIEEIAAKKDQANIDFWQDELADYKRLDIFSTETTNEHFQKIYERDFVEGLKEKLERDGVSLKSLFFGAFVHAFNMLTYEEDLVVGLVSNNRPMVEDGDKILGCFLNTLPVRVRFEEFGTASWRSYLQEIEAQLNALKTKDRLTLLEITKITGERVAEGNPFFDVLFNYVDFHIYNEVNLAEESAAEEELQIDSYESTNTTLDLNVAMNAENLSFKYSLTQSLKAGIALEKLHGYVEQVLLHYRDQSTEKRSNQSFLSSTETQTLLQSFNDTQVDYPSDKTVLDLFQEQVTKAPDAIAVVYQDVELSFKTLDEYTNQLSAYLRDRYAIQANDRIGIRLERSEWMLVAILGTLKSGAAYVPMGMDYPEERLDYIRKDSQYKVCLDAQNMEAFKAVRKSYSTVAANPQIHPEQLAYAIYTSGSTGVPKGVLNQHSGLLNRLLWMIEDLEITAADVFLQKTPYTFDVSVWELILPLTTGSKLIFAQAEGHKDPEYLQDLIAKEKINIIHFVPSMLGAFLYEVAPGKCASLKRVVCSGEALPLKMVEQFRTALPGTRIHNYYGPTEAAIDVTAVEVTNTTEVNIGFPVANTQIYILSQNLELQPQGVPGELLIGGVQVARGYLNRPELNAEKFIENPFGKGMAYRTGDLASWKADGSIDYLGRIDNQVKIRGNRIELGEIENAFQQSALVNRSVVLVREDQMGNKQLVAYVQATEAYEQELIQAHLKNKLPGYMIPSWIVELEEFPVTANGKLNRRALPDPDLSTLAREQYVAPESEVEIKIAEIWAKILGREQIGIHDNFFKIGGDSIISIRLVSRMNKALGTNLKVGDLYEYNTIANLVSWMAKGTETQAEEIAIRESLQEMVANLNAEVLSAPGNEGLIEEVYPMSDIQKGMILLSIIHPEEAMYHDQFVFQIPRVELDLFEQAFALLIEKHATFRTSFDLDTYSREVQVVAKKVPVNIEVKDLSTLSATKQEREIQAYIESERQRPFDFKSAPLWRATIFHVKEKGSVFVLQFHHAILDGWSLASFNTELFQTYQVLEKNPQFKPQKLQATYKDAVLEELTQKNNQASIDYWKDTLSEYKRLAIFSNTPQSNVYTHTYDRAFTNQLQQLAKEDGLLLKTILLGAFSYALNLLIYEDDVLIGLVSNNRPALEDGDEILGCFLNTLPLRIPLASHQNSSWINYFKALDHQLLDLKTKDKLTLLEISKIVGERASDENPFFDVLFNYIDFHIYNDLSAPSSTDDIGLDIPSFESTNTLLDLDVSASGGVLNFRYEQTRQLKSNISLEQLHAYVEKILHAYMSGAGTAIAKEALLSATEKKQLLEVFNDTAIAYPEDESILDLFTAQAHQSPNQTALVCAENTWTYQELEATANRLAAHLQNQFTIQADDFISIELERSEWMIIAILAVLKTGAAYIPIDPTYPQERIDFILQDSECIGKIDADLLEEFRNTKATPATFEAATISPDQLAYVIYTSGSTGRPKGVMIRHRSLADYVQTVKNYFELNNTDRLVQQSSISFDTSIEEIFPILIAGGTLFIQKDRQDLDSLFQECQDQQITVLSTNPFAIKYLNENGNKYQLKLKTLISGGDVLKYEYLDGLLDQMAIYNTYGPTESTVCATYYRVRTAASSLPIGKPIANRQVYILDKNESLLPMGVAGEIALSGRGVAKGYLNRPVLNAEKFVEHPFIPGERLYKTGDLGRWLPDGNVLFLGRKDDQVKIRGYRIELGEIEYELQQKEGVRSAAVIAREMADGEKELVAYLIANEEQDTAGLRLFLSDKLPDYMLPSHFVQMASWPLTANGKLDKKQLPDPLNQEMTRGTEYVIPATEKEKALAAVWEEVLSREGVGLQDNFYHLGGDSIKSIQVVSRLKQHGFLLRVEQLLRHPVLGNVAPLLELGTQTVDQSEVVGAVALNPIQHSFFEDGFILVRNHFNQSVLLKSKGELDTAIIRQCMTALVKHHDALRMTYREEEGQWQQFNEDTSKARFRLEFHDLRNEEQELVTMEQIGTRLQSSFDLSHGPLLQIAHFRLNDGDRLALIVHHLVIDGISWRILFEDLATLYAQFQAGAKATLPLKTDSFQRWTALQKKQTEHKQITTELPYWQSVSNHQVPTWPTKKPAPETPVLIDKRISFTLDKNQTALFLSGINEVYNTDANDVLLTCLGIAVKEIFGAHQSMLEMEGHGREEIFPGVDISRTVAWFTTVFPFMLEVPTETSLRETLVWVKESLRKIPNKGIGYGMLKYLHPDRPVLDFHPSMVFNYLGDFGSQVGTAEEAVFTYSSESIGPEMDASNEDNTLLNVVGMLVSDELTISMTFASAVHQFENVLGLSESFEKNLHALIEDLANEKQTYQTPADYTFKGLQIKELAALNAAYDVEDIYQLSPLQHGLYFHWIAQLSNSMYCEQMSYRISTNEIDIAAIQATYNELLSRHAVLRTSFTGQYADTTLQIVHQQVDGHFSFEKIPSGLTQQKIEPYIQSLKIKDREQGFDPEMPSQMRLKVVALGEGEYEFIWSHHHILMDGWCMSLLINDFYQILYARQNNRLADLPQPLPYSNYIQWVQQVDTDASQEYWGNYLEDYSDAVSLPFQLDSTASAYRAEKEVIKIDGELHRQFSTVIKKLGVTENTFVQGAWGYLLSRYNHTNDVVYGAVVSGRPADLPGVEEMIGLFINTIPVRIKYEAKDTPADLLKTLHEEGISGTNHHYLNLSDIQSQSHLGRDLINHITIFENFPVQELIQEEVGNNEEEDLTITAMEIFEQTNYDFNILIIPSGDALTIELKYNGNRFEQEGIQRIGDHFQRVLAQFVAAPQQALAEVNYLSTEERNTILHTFNKPKTDYPKAKTIVDLFAEQVARSPEATAILYEGKEWSYRQLAQASDRLAAYLRQTYDIQRDDRVGIMLPRTDWMLVTMLGIIKSGAAYVPIDPNYPQARKEYVIEDAQCKVIIEEKELASFQAVAEDYSGVRVEAINRPEDLMYVIYTSGSTGRPKGVMLEHRNVVSFLHEIPTQLGYAAAGVIASTTNITFDISVLEIFSAFCHGKQLSLFGDDYIDPERFADKLTSDQVEVLQLTPSRLSQLAEVLLHRSLPALKHLLVGGEAFPEKIFQQRTELGDLNLINVYGPTETTIWSSSLDLMKSNRLTIGRPLENEQMYLLDERGELQPIGVAGEICIGGAGVARGYFNREELTQEKFIPNPFSPGERLYKTGDLGRWLSDGTIEFLGRNDDQVKIRGHRIETGEIETLISTFADSLIQIVVMAVERREEKVLAAYFVASEEIIIPDLRTFLQQELPGYMVPSYFIQLETMPLNASGKVARKALPSISEEDIYRKEFVLPETEMETHILDIWKEVLDLQKISVTDNFFDIGGNSISIVRLFNKLKTLSNTSLTIAQLFDHNNIQSQAQLLVPQEEENPESVSINEIEF